MRHLGAEPDDEPVFQRIVAGHQAAPFERHAEALMDEKLVAEDMRRGGEGGLRVAVAHVEFGKDIVFGIGMGERRSRPGGFFRIGGGGQNVVIDLDEGGGVFGDVAVVGNNHRDGFPDMADLLVGENRAVAKLPVGLARHTDRQPVRRQVRREVRHGQHGADAGLCAGDRRVDAFYQPMGNGASDEGGLEHSREMDIVRIAAPAGQKGRVFDAADRLAEGAGHGGSVERRMCGQSVIPPDYAQYNGANANCIPSAGIFADIYAGSGVLAGFAGHDARADLP